MVVSVIDVFGSSSAWSVYSGSFSATLFWKLALRPRFTPSWRSLITSFTLSRQDSLGLGGGLLGLGGGARGPRTLVARADGAAGHHRDAGKSGATILFTDMNQF